ncbi:hypothetical protein K440DRAFT_656808 [Wilcoxina mikolae CBS 423.85]|nr:hypothetical protein K440DRAFT_656808 [Wilcoxina mikolae CBS 423.85]
MVTGVETAGLVLAAFPLLAQGLGQYLEGARKIRDMRKYEIQLKQWVRKIEMEQYKFEDTGERLLEYTSAKWVGSCWECPEIDIALRERLHEKDISVFKTTIEALKLSLQQLCDATGFTEEDQSVKMRVHKKQWKKIKLVLEQPDNEKLLEEIRILNLDLAQLVSQPPSPVVIKSNRSAVTEHYNRVRKHAKILHDVFLERFQTAICHCRSPHNASLQIQKTPEEAKVPRDSRLKVLFQLQIMSSVNLGGWRSLEFEPVVIDSHQTGRKHITDFQSESDSLRGQTKSPQRRGFRDSLFRRTKSSDSCPAEDDIPKTGKVGRARKVSFLEPPPSIAHPALPTCPFPAADESPKIEDLCSTIIGTNVPVKSCVGVLFDERNVNWRVWSSPILACPVKSPPPACMPDAVTLESLLVPGYLERKDRLQLGVLLAATVMQLHSTDWLNECWGKRDIYFLLRADQQRRALDGNCYPVPAIDQPFVRRSFGSSQMLVPLPASNLPSGTPDLVDCDRNLFSLGVILVELWFEQRIEDLRPASAINRAKQTVDNGAYETVKQLMGDIFTYAGEDYGLVISRCINGLNRSIGMKQGKDRSLENEVFKNDVYTNVVLLLERNLEVFLKAYA